MADNILERRATYLIKLMTKTVPQLKAREDELKAKAEKTVDEDEELVVIIKSIQLMGDNEVDPGRTLGAWVAKMLLEAE